MLVHNAQHIVVPLISHPLYKCWKCNRNFSSDTILSQHKESQHGIKKKSQSKPNKENNNTTMNTSIKDQNVNNYQKEQNTDREKPDPRNNSQKPSQNNIFEKPDSQYKKPDLKNNNNETQNVHNMIKKDEKDDIIDISDSSNDSDSKPIARINTIDVLNSMINKEPLITCDSIVNELIKRAHVKNAVEKQPVILVDDSLSRLLCNQSFTNGNKFSEHDDTLAELIKINSKANIQNIDNAQENELKDLDYEVATINKIPQDAFESIPTVKLVSLEDSNSTETLHIKNRLIFEDDEEEDLITFDNVPGTHKHTEVNAPNEMELYQGKIVLGTRKTETCMPSVHYYNLIEDGSYDCQRCKRICSNR